MTSNPIIIPAHLPRRLTISFPIWGLMHTYEESVYADLDRFVKEHVERGFNCMRLESFAGLTHDIHGNLRGKVAMGPAFDDFDILMRQMITNGRHGTCDFMERMIQLFEAAQKYNVFIILSSWYYLHTYWMVEEPGVNEEMFAIPPLERFQVFARYLHYILCELEQRGLDDRIAFAEIFNEADGLPFVDGYGKRNQLSVTELHRFRRAHGEAIAWLRQKHPQLLFAFDSYTYWADEDQIPVTMQVYNFHNYYVWNAYAAMEKNAQINQEILMGKYTEADIRRTREGRIPAAEDWYTREWYYNDLDPEKMDRAEAFLKEYLANHMEDYRKRLHDSIRHMRTFADQHFPGVPLVTAEGTSYCGSKLLLWEEHDENYWKLVEEATLAYKKAGLWGMIPRTCCGPEDRLWREEPQKFRQINELFLKEE